MTQSKFVEKYFLNNPYNILGVSRNADENCIYDAREEILEEIELGIEDIYETDFRLEELERPERTKSSVNTAINLIKKEDYMLVWFANSNNIKLETDEGNLKEYYCAGRIWDVYDLFVSQLLHFLLYEIKNNPADKMGKLLEMLIIFLENKPFEKEADDKIFTSFTNDTFVDVWDDMWDQIFNEIPEKFQLLTLLELKKYEWKKKNGFIERCEKMIFLNIVEKNERLYEIINSKFMMFFRHELKDKIDNHLEECVKPIINIWPQIPKFGMVYEQLSKSILDLLDIILQYIDRKYDVTYKYQYVNMLYKLVDEPYKKELRDEYGIENLNVPSEDILPDDYYKIAKKYSDNVYQQLFWLKQAANVGHIKSALIIAEYYENGYPVEQDDEQAYQWYKKAADLGDSSAKLKVAEILHDGIGVLPDYDLSKALLSELEMEGNLKAKELLKGWYESYPHISYDLGYIECHEIVRSMILFTLNKPAHVRLIEKLEYSRYMKRTGYIFVGEELREDISYRKIIPHSGYWILVIDREGDSVDGINITFK